jgi:hypothetical protein
MSTTFVAERSVPLDVIRIDGGTQSRSKINEDVVSTYAQNMEDGSVFPPAVLFFDGKDYWLADGFHRYHANRKNKKQGMVCRITNGTLREAILYSYGANGLHGLQMSNEDKRRIVLEMLNDFEWSEWSDREIARQCHVSHTFVNKLRNASGNVATDKVKYKNKDGDVFERERKVKDKKPVSVNVAKEPVAQVTDKHDEKEEAIQFLIEENEKLKDQLAKATSEDPEFAGNHIQELRDELKQAQIELKAVTKSRDLYQSECAQLKKQVAYYQRELKKAA